MPNVQTTFARGLLMGAAGVALWAAARKLTGNTPPALLDWEMAGRVATRASGADGRLTQPEKARLLAEYRALVQAVEGPLQEYTGTALSLADTAVEVMDRPDWIRANVGNFQQLFEPVEQAYGRSVSEGGPGALVLAPATRMILSSQFGLLIGYLARRVLGQYDVSLLGKEPVTAGKLYFVEPNIRALERTLGAPAAELRQWIALHEATHAHEFEVHPWVRSYLNTHLRSYLRSVVDDMLGGPGRGPMSGMVTRLASNIRQGHNLFSALMTPQQREIVSRLQALMSLAEGYSNHVMNRVGARLLPHYEEIHERVEHRQRQRGQIEELFLRLTGLKMKMEQYALGEKFASRVADERDVAFLNQAWQAPERLPTEAEIRDPDRWIARMEAMGPHVRALGEGLNGSASRDESASRGSGVGE